MDFFTRITRTPYCSMAVDCNKNARWGAPFPEGKISNLKFTNVLIENSCFSANDIQIPWSIQTEIDLRGRSKSFTLICKFSVKISADKNQYRNIFCQGTDGNTTNLVTGIFCSGMYGASDAGTLTPRFYVKLSDGTVCLAGETLSPEKYTEDVPMVLAGRFDFSSCTLTYFRNGTPILQNSYPEKIGLSLISTSNSKTSISLNGEESYLQKNNRIYSAFLYDCDLTDSEIKAISMMI